MPWETISGPADDKWETVSAPSIENQPDKPERIPSATLSEFGMEMDPEQMKNLAKLGLAYTAAVPAMAAGPIAAGAGRLLANPLVSAGMGAVTEGYKGGLPGAIRGAVEGYALNKSVGAIPAGLKWLGKIVKMAPAASTVVKATPAAIAATEAAVRGAASVSPTLSNVTFTVGRSAAPAIEAAAEAAPAGARAIQATVAGEKTWAVLDAAGNPVQTFRTAAEAVKASNALKAAAKAIPAAAKTAAPAAAEAAPAVATATKAAATASRGAEVAARHNALVQFAKDAAAKNPKLGEKIWVALDPAGNPIRILTPDQAGAVKRAGQATTWVRNLWR
jgi:hypothetical protein